MAWHGMAWHGMAWHRQRAPGVARLRQRAMRSEPGSWRDRGRETRDDLTRMFLGIAYSVVQEQRRNPRFEHLAVAAIVESADLELRGSDPLLVDVVRKVVQANETVHVLLGGGDPHRGRFVMTRRNPQLR